VISSSESSSWVWPVLASIGGFVVFVGLLIEKAADWMNERYVPLEEYEPHKALENIGWTLLMIGILAEIVFGFALAAKDDKHERDTTAQAIQASNSAVRADLRKQPMFSFSAQAHFLIRPIGPSNLVADLEASALPSIIGDNWFGKDFNGGVARRYPYGGNLTNSFWSHPTNSSQLLLGEKQKMEAVTFAQNVTVSSVSDDNGQLFRIDIYIDRCHLGEGNSLASDNLDTIVMYLPVDAHVLDGTVEMEIDNGIIPGKVFKIPQQTTFNKGVSSFLINGTFIPLSHDLPK
jgi:hypothetical protein